VENLFLDNETRMMVDSIRKLIQRVVIPIEQKLGPFESEIPIEYIVSVQETAKKMGFWQMGALTEWGGGGLDIFIRTILMEEASRHRFGLVYPALNAFGKEIPTILTKLHPSLIETAVKPAVESGKGCFIAVDSCSNFVAKRGSQNGWAITGNQKFVANADQAVFGLVWAKIDGSEETGLFLVENCERVASERIVVMRTLNFFNITLKDYQVSGEHYLGEGNEMVGEMLKELQILLAARCLGVAQEALRLCAEYATQRETFGKLLETREAIQNMVADSMVELSSNRLLTWCMAKKLSLNDATEEDIAMAKLSATEKAFQIVDRALQILGSMGTAQEMPLERWYRELRLARIELVPSERIRNMLALSSFQKYH